MNVAFRMLGSTHDAEDVVQDAYARWYALSDDARRAIRSQIAWLVRVTSRICLDQLTSARVRRERYVGDWLPEPLPGEARWVSTAKTQQGDPAERVTLDDSVSMGVLVMLESVTPAERVAFVLHDVFNLPHTEIADIVGRTPEACRQLAASARRHLRRDRRLAVNAQQHRSIVSAFRAQPKGCASGSTHRAAVRACCASSGPGARTGPSSAAGSGSFHARQGFEERGRCCGLSLEEMPYRVKTQPRRLRPVV